MASGHCFSGSVNVDDNNNMVCVFTDTNKGECIAISNDNGRKFIYDETEIIKHVGRDPKLIKYNDHWVIVVYEQMPEEDKFGFYISYDLKNWEMTSCLTGFRECSEMFELCVDNDTNNKKWVIFGYDSMYKIGTFDGKIFIPDHENKLKLHYGQFQASQCFNLAPNNRVIQIGWASIDLIDMPFNQTFSLPIELSLKTTKDGIKLHGIPVNEINQLRYDVQSFKNIIADDNRNKLLTIKTVGQLFDILVEVKLDDVEMVKLTFGDNNICYDNIKNELDGIFITLDNNILKLRIVVDKPMYEYCVNDGIIYNTLKRNDSGMDINNIDLLIIGKNTIVNDFSVYKMKSIWK